MTDHFETLSYVISNLFRIYAMYLFSNAYFRGQGKVKNGVTLALFFWLFYSKQCWKPDLSQYVYQYAYKCRSLLFIDVFISWILFKKGNCRLYFLCSQLMHRCFFGVNRIYYG